MNFGKSSISKKIAPRTSKKVAHKIKFTLLRLVLLGILVLLIGGGIYGVSVVRKIIADAPDISNVAVSPTEAATYIYNQAGQRVRIW